MEHIAHQMAHTAVRAVTYRTVGMLMHGHGLGVVVIGALIILAAWVILRLT